MHCRRVAGIDCVWRGQAERELEARGEEQELLQEHTDDAKREVPPRHQCHYQTSLIIC